MTELELGGAGVHTKKSGMSQIHVYPGAVYPLTQTFVMKNTPTIKSMEPFFIIQFSGYDFITVCLLFVQELLTEHLRTTSMLSMK